MRADLIDAPDVLFFSSEVLTSLAAAGVLARAELTAQSYDETALSAASYSGTAYAYPCAVDTFFLYYDKSRLNEKDTKKLERILENDSKNAAFVANLSDSSLIGSLLLGAGCKVTQPYTFAQDDSRLAAEYLIDLVREGELADLDDHEIKSAFARREIAAAVSSAENAEAIASSLGKDFGTAKLPLVGLSDGREIQPVSAASYLLVGVRSGSGVSETAQELAQWLTSADNQLVRLEKQGLVPADISLTEDKELLERYPAVRAVYEQLQYSTVMSAPQNEAFCSLCEELGRSLVSGDEEMAADCLGSFGISSINGRKQ